MTAPLWSDERIHTQAITYSGYISSVIRALTEVRDEYEAHRIALETAYADLFAQHAQMAVDLAAAGKRVRELEKKLAAKSEIPF